MPPCPSVATLENEPKECSLSFPRLEESFCGQGSIVPPAVRTLEYSAGQTRANNAVVALGSTGDAIVHCGQATGSVHLILDVNGYFQ